MAASNVDFKANANGLVVVFDRDEPFDSIYEQLSRKLESGGMFFQTRYLATSYRGRKLSAEEEGRISRMMSEKTGARTVIFEFDKDFVQHGSGSGIGIGAANSGAAAVSARTVGSAGGAGNDGTGNSGGGAGIGDAGFGSTGSTAAGSVSGISGSVSSGSVSNGSGNTGSGNTGLGDNDATDIRFHSSEIRARDIANTLRRRYDTQDLNECMTRFCRGTLRSGKLVSYNGNVVIIGDINPGAEVEATGNIVVIGNVRGIVHAGAGGNKEASVIALHFAPTQLRIADIITNKVERKPVHGRVLGTQPAEIAYIIGDEIVFEKLSTV